MVVRCLKRQKLTDFLLQQSNGSLKVDERLFLQEYYHNEAGERVFLNFKWARPEDNIIDDAHLLAAHSDVLNSKYCQKPTMAVVGGLSCLVAGERISANCYSRKSVDDYRWRVNDLSDLIDAVLESVGNKPPWQRVLNQSSLVDYVPVEFFPGVDWLRGPVHGDVSSYVCLIIDLIIHLTDEYDLTMDETVSATIAFAQVPNFALFFGSACLCLLGQ